MVVNFWFRMLGVFIGTALPIYIAGEMLTDMSSLNAALTGGLVAVLRVGIKIADAVRDGKLTKKEIDDAFGNN